MPSNVDFIERLESKVRKQLVSHRVGFLLGAGSSYLDGNGYPLTSELWDIIRGLIPHDERTAIQAKLDEGASGIEHALDLLDDGGVHDTPHRHSVTNAIAEYFSTISPPLDTHIEFLRRLSLRLDPTIPILNLNYDPLIERAAERNRLRFVDGFLGSENGYFEPAVFQQRIGIVHRGRRYPQVQWANGILNLFKLHGSVGWYECPTLGVRRCAYDTPIQLSTKRLMIPPQCRKATETMELPYASLWSEMRGMLRHGPYLINRLASIGYGMGDEHVNAVIENGLARADLTLMIFARDLTAEVFNRWSVKHNVIVVTNNCSSLYGEQGPGHPDLWSFERLCQEV